MSTPFPHHTWIKYTKTVTGEGILPNCTVLKMASEGSYHPFVVCTAVWQGDAWTYANGDYHLIIEEALLNPRLKGG